MNGDKKAQVSLVRRIADDAALSGTVTAVVAGIADTLDWYDGKITAGNAISNTSSDVVDACQDGALRGAALEATQSTFNRFRKYLPELPQKNSLPGRLRSYVVRRIVSGKIYIAANLMVDIAGLVYNQGLSGMSKESLMKIARSSSFRSVAAFAVVEAVSVFAGPVIGKIASHICGYCNPESQS